MSTNSRFGVRNLVGSWQYAYFSSWMILEVLMVATLPVTPKRMLMVASSMMMMRWMRIFWDEYCPFFEIFIEFIEIFFSGIFRKMALNFSINLRNAIL
jgi:hypothetical protein